MLSTCSYFNFETNLPIFTKLGNTNMADTLAFEAGATLRVPERDMRTNIL
jgi:hypothetical protein